ncbi:hypothetical protein QYF61_007870 [Mycteria americana]|uniref:Uncharacterized protein n=1 Tax=Mycteria americana TaxID=33587 RepID=A0AAN7RXZ9_MYCAM|nr:hypothetical protein QYF61_007870 [Mycteria americana]
MAESWETRAWCQQAGLQQALQTMYYHKCYVYITQDQLFHSSGILYSFWGTTIKERCRELEKVQRTVIRMIEV